MHPPGATIRIGQEIQCLPYAGFFGQLWTSSADLKVNYLLEDYRNQGQGLNDPCYVSNILVSVYLQLNIRNNVITHHKIYLDFTDSSFCHL